MNEFDKKEFYNYLLSKDCQKAMSYLKNYPEMAKGLKKYQRIFIKRRIRPKKINFFIDEVLLAYSHYYCDALYDKLEMAQDVLVKRLNNLLNMDSSEIDIIEKELEKRFNDEGFQFIGGCIDGIYGPYIWKETIEKYFTVELPFGVIKLKIYFLDKFISKSWIDFISLGKIKISFLQSSNFDSLSYYVIKRSYSNLLKPKFQISFLKHFASIALDEHLYGKMKEKDLEYRALLVELIYYPNISKLKSILLKASDGNKDDYESYSSFIILKNLSKKIFNQEIVWNIDLWKGKVKLVQKYSLELLIEHNSKINKVYYEVIDII